MKSKEDAPSVSAFRAHFCADEATVPSESSGSGFRENMTQPGVYWLLEAPFVRIIGLYSNLLENPGLLQGKTDNGDDDPSQLDWLKKTLTKIAKNATKKALIIATHHPPCSQSGHSGSTEMSQSIDEICNSTGVFPDAFFSGHAHKFKTEFWQLGDDHTTPFDPLTVDLKTHLLK